MEWWQPLGLYRWRRLSDGWVGYTNSKAAAVAFHRDRPGWKRGIVIDTPQGETWQWTGDAWQRVLL
jgi:hypothetical protein